MNKKERIRGRNWLIRILFLAGVVIVCVALYFMLRGKTTTTGQYPEDISDNSLVCNAEGIGYKFFTYDGSTKKTAEIKVLFSKEKLKSIALTYNLYYNDTTSIIASEAHNRASMNKSFRSIGPKIADAYNAKYA